MLCVYCRNVKFDVKNINIIMKSCLLIENILPSGEINKSDFIEVDRGAEPEVVWQYLMQAIKELKNDEYNGNTSLTFEKFVNRLLAFDRYSTSIEAGEDWIDFDITIQYEENSITMIAINRDKVECFRKTYVTSDDNEGNCVDDFIRRGIEPLLNNIIQLKDSIKSRKSERASAVEYHMTGCYEKDFGQISLIKQLAEKLVSNSNTHLERISEFYTKLY